MWYDYSQDILMQEKMRSSENSDLRSSCLGSLIGLVVSIVLCVLLSLLATGCRTKYVPVVTVRDSIRTEVVTNTVYVADTQYVTLPPQTVERTTPDTTSTLRTLYATSTASVMDGLLYHSLTTNTVPVPVPVQHQVVTRDSIVYREKEVPVPVPVVQEVAKPLSTWQQVRLWIANLVLVALAVAAGVWVYRWKRRMVKGQR